jgi:hypothetical protein
MRSNYDDLMGLDMYDGLDGMEYTPEMFKEQLIAAGSSAVAIILAAWGMPKLPAPKDWTPENQHRMRATLAVVVGMLASRGLWNYNRDAAMAVLGGVGGLGLAQLLDSYLTPDKDGKRLITIGTPFGDYGYDSNALSAGDEALLTAYSRDTRTLSALELTNVASAPGAFAAYPDGPVSFGATGVNAETLMGAVVQTETLGNYNPYMA